MSKLGNKSPMSVKESPDKTPKNKDSKRKLSNEENEATSPITKVQAVATNLDKPTLSNSVSSEKNQNELEFSVMFNAPTVSLFDSATKELLEVLSKAKDVHVNRSLIVTCKEEKQKEQLISELREHPQSKNFFIPFKVPNKGRAYFLYAVGLPDCATINDLKKACRGARCSYFLKYPRSGKIYRVGRIKFDEEKVMEEFAKRKVIQVCGEDVPLVLEKHDMKQRIKDMQVADVSRKKGGMTKVVNEKAGRKMVKEAEEEDEKGEAEDEEEEAEDMDSAESLTVTCKEEKQKEQLIPELREHPQSKNFNIPFKIPKKDQAFFLYAVGLPDCATISDLKKACRGAKSSYFLKYPRSGKIYRVGRIKFDEEKVMEEFAKRKVIQVCGEDVPLVLEKDDMKQRIKDMQVADVSRKKGGMTKVVNEKAGRKMVKEAEEEDEKGEAEDEEEEA